MASSAQLVTTFDPVAWRPAQLPLGEALAAWRSLDEAQQSEALLIVFEEAQRTRVLGRAAISQLAMRGVA